MEPVRLTGQEFMSVLESGEAFEEIVGLECGSVLVDGDGLPDVLGRQAMLRLRMVPAVVVALVGDPSARPPAWSDLAVEPDSEALETTLATLDAQPLASTTLATLLRGGQERSIPDGLVAESTAYGLLQHGPEFTAWRTRTPGRQRPAGVGPPVLVDRSDSELTITLNRPHVHNALDAAMRDELLAALQVAVVDPTIDSVVLLGSGPSFCSGGDLDEFGSTVGSGIELAAFAHRVVADRSTRISLPEVHLGLIPGAGGTVSLPRRIGRHATMLLAVGLPWIDAATALGWGLVDGLEG
jgi:hypothetical protein